MTLFRRSEVLFGRAVNLYGNPEELFRREVEPYRTSVGLFGFPGKWPGSLMKPSGRSVNLFERPVNLFRRPVKLFASPEILFGDLQPGTGKSGSVRAARDFWVLWGKKLDFSDFVPYKEGRALNGVAGRRFRRFRAYERK